MKLSIRIGTAASVATAAVLLLTRSLVIAAAFGFLAAGISFVMVRGKNNINEAALIAAWPESSHALLWASAFRTSWFMAHMSFYASSFTCTWSLVSANSYSFENY